MFLTKKYRPGWKKVNKKQYHYIGINIKIYKKQTFIYKRYLDNMRLERKNENKNKRERNVRNKYF